MSDTFIIALSKGRIYKETLPLLAQAGIELLDDPVGEVDGLVHVHQM